MKMKQEGETVQEAPSRDVCSALGILLAKEKQLKKELRGYKKIGNKILIYVSKGGNYKLNLNGKVKDVNNLEIACRQLAHLVMILKMKKYHVPLSSIQQIFNQDLLKNNVYDTKKIFQNSQYYRFFPLDKFGEQLKAIGEIIKEGESYSLLLSSGNHLMSFLIQRKAYGMYSVKFYDPNHTNIHVRILFKDLDTMGSSPMKLFLNADCMSKYFRKGGACVFFSPYTRKKNEKPSLYIHPDYKESRFLCRFLREGCAETMYEICKAILESDMPVSKKIKILRDGTLNTSVDFSSRHKGFLQGFCAYYKAILESDLPATDKMTLLPENENLVLALQRGYLVSVKACFHKVLESNLTASLKARLLSFEDVGCKKHSSKYLSHKRHLILSLMKRIKHPKSPSIAMLVYKKITHSTSPLIFSALKINKMTIVKYIGKVISSDFAKGMRLIIAYETKDLEVFKKAFKEADENKEYLLLGRREEPRLDCCRPSCNCRL